MDEWLAALPSQAGSGSSAKLYRAATEGRLDEAALLWAAASSLGIQGPQASAEEPQAPAAQPLAEAQLPPELESAASSAVLPPSAAPAAAAAPAATAATPAPATSPGRSRPLRSAALAASEAWGPLKPDSGRHRSGPGTAALAAAAAAAAGLRTPAQLPLTEPPVAAPSTGFGRKRSLEDLLNRAEGEQAPAASQPSQRPPLPPAARLHRSPTAPAAVAAAAGPARPGSAASSGGRGRPASAAAAAPEPALLYHEQRLQYAVQRTLAPQYARTLAQQVPLEAGLQAGGAVAAVVRLRPGVCSMLHWHMTHVLCPIGATIAALVQAIAAGLASQYGLHPAVFTVQLLLPGMRSPPGAAAAGSSTGEQQAASAQVPWVLNSAVTIRQLLEVLFLQAAPGAARSSDLVLEYEAAAPGVPSGALAAAAAKAKAAAAAPAVAVAAAKPAAVGPAAAAGVGAPPAVEAASPDTAATAAGAAPAGALAASPSTDSLLQLALLAAEVWGEQLPAAGEEEPGAAAAEQQLAVGEQEAAAAEAGQAAAAGEAAAAIEPAAAAATEGVAAAGAQAAEEAAQEAAGQAGVAASAGREGEAVVQAAEQVGGGGAAPAAAAAAAAAADGAAAAPAPAAAEVEAEEVQTPKRCMVARAAPQAGSWWQKAVQGAVAGAPAEQPAPAVAAPPPAQQAVVQVGEGEAPPQQAVGSGSARTSSGSSAGIAGRTPSRSKAPRWRLLPRPPSRPSE